MDKKRCNLSFGTKEYHMHCIYQQESICRDRRGFKRICRNNNQNRRIVKMNETLKVLKERRTC